jgi:hypothetical protein
MGLSVKPTFGKPPAAARPVPSAPLSGGASPWQQTASAAPPAAHPPPAPSSSGAPGSLLREPAIAAELARETAESNPKWDDDTDLDDLLDD